MTIDIDKRSRSFYNETGNEWKQANFVGKLGNIALCYTDSPQAENLISINETADIEDKKNKKLWIRIAPDHHNCIEYRLGNKDSNFSADDEVDESCIIELKELAIIKG